MIICVDAMGGDFAPKTAVLGAVKAVNNYENLKVILVGKEDAIMKQLKGVKYPKKRLEIMHAEQVIEMDDHVADVVRGKRKSSMHVCIKLVKDGKADAFFTAGNSGVAMAVSALTLGILPGVTRPAIGIVLPASNERGCFLMLDVGANVDCRPEHLVTFAIMGQAYAKKVMHINKPVVGLLSNGEEEGKGDMLTKSVYPVLKECETINFMGNVEAKALFKGEADVVVCDGFVGNIALKTSQSVAKLISETMKAALKKNIFTKIGALLSLPAFKQLKSKTDSSQYGGAPLLGVKGVCIIGHGSTDDEGVCNGIRVAMEAVKGKINDAITDDVENSMTSIIQLNHFN